MFESERPSFIRVAGETHLVLRRSGTQLLRKESTMLVMTVRAADQPLLNPMPERPREVLFNFGMAAVAKLRLPLDEQKLWLLGMMRRMAGGAADRIDVVLRALKICMLLAISMALHAALADLLGSDILEGEYLCLVPTAGHVLRPRPVTPFASLPFRVSLVQSRFPVGRGFKILENVFVTRLASLCPDILGIFR
jgi:hypothetical protein